MDTAIGFWLLSGHSDSQCDVNSEVV